MRPTLLQRRGDLSQGRLFAQSILRLSGLLAYWRLNDTDAVLRDAAGIQPNGTYPGAPSAPALGPALIPGDPSAASRDFEDTIGQRANPGALIDLRPGTVPGITVGCMCRIESGAKTGTTGIIFSQSNGSGNNNSFWLDVDWGAGNQPRVGGWGGTYQVGSMPADTDVFLVATQDTATGAAHIYIDGVEAGTGGTPLVMTALPAESSIGKWSVVGFGNHDWDGLIGELFIVGRVLSASEIASLAALT